VWTSATIKLSIKEEAPIKIGQGGLPA
jgi:hypothetical protein